MTQVFELASMYCRYINISNIWLRVRHDTDKQMEEKRVFVHKIDVECKSANFFSLLLRLPIHKNRNGFAILYFFVGLQLRF